MQQGLRHFPPANPADVDLPSIAPGEAALLRGLGLNFFDYMSLLTTGRGGHFTRTTNGLVYHRSGREPHMYASSRRGIPYQARGDNEKGPFERHLPLLLTDEVIHNFRKRANTRDAPNFMTEVWPLVSKEVQTVYYEGVLGQARSEKLNFQAKFLATPHNSPQETQLLNEVGIPDTQRWSWDRILQPHGGRTFASATEWRDWMINYLHEGAAQAKLGNLNGPLKAALDVMRDLRNELRLIVDHGGLSGVSRREHLDSWYTPINAFLSIGPPRLRIDRNSRHWPNLRNTGDELLAYLLKTGQCRPHTINGYETGGLDVTLGPFRLIDSQGHAHARRFAVGVPTEGVHWVTFAGARPGVNSVTLSDTVAAARGVLHTAMTEIERGYYIAAMEEVKTFPMVEVEALSVVV
ncbi:fad -dependent oxidoreductase [Trichoderma arundinaceum]|uniref:Fad-dependent oxidoreductase n=1 Tax=Trichoderma arundinaceum TaxID=490622 RepID=A0A395N9D0_TRIAR|nr:fad -dependent oxidoreductase [Trichoderma arundinaceum]